MRRDFDFYPTPMSIVRLMVDKYVKNTPAVYYSTPVWEPCAGDGRIAEALKDAGVCDVMETDVQRGQDFFDFDHAPMQHVVTNPPFKGIRKFIDHAFAIGVKRMALVCPERLWACKKGHEQFQRHRPNIFANMDWREDYLGKGGSPDRALAVSIWWQPCADTCYFDVWSRDDVTSRSSDHEDC